ncbi:MAG: hypothetical protein EKK63_15765 [Acinetobacter sp.]|uniref:hypothetical protein n=1 Tax=Acinetobacter sp. TaxID=472 RepID=UPI000F9A68B2|nr:hypothetical protein [Acinetobacter sp.]RUP37026.1 MAG: hypothetical protein EKK63_15765 [Acinetobacter sp.]
MKTKLLKKFRKTYYIEVGDKTDHRLYSPRENAIFFLLKRNNEFFYHSAGIQGEASVANTFKTQNECINYLKEVAVNHFVALHRKRKKRIIWP